MMFQGAGPASTKALGKDKAWHAPRRTVVRKVGRSLVLEGPCNPW